MAKPAILMSALLLVAPGLAWSQPGADDPVQAEADRAAARTRFKCQDAPDLTARFASRDAGLVAIVDAGDGPHALPVQPWTGGPAKLVWTDGHRTLTWSPGVQIMWVDGRTHRMCGRGEHRH